MEKFAVMAGSFGGLFSITEKLLDEGIFVFCLDIDSNAGKNLEKKYPNNCIFIRTDISSKKEIEKARKKIFKKTKKIDYLINGVCQNPFKPFKKLSLEEIENSLNMTLMSYIYTTKIFWDMFETGGSIVNISSVHSLRTKNNFSVYSIAKAGVNALTRSMSLELRDRDVRVNGIIPGGFTDDLYKKMNLDWKKKLKKRQVSTPEDIAEVVSFLLNPISRAINGELIVCDCGLNALSAKSSDL